MSEASMSLPDVLLLPKLSPPRIRAELVRRTRLLELLDGVQTHELTLVSASAGFGKTTLLSAWALQNAQQVAWLSLDEQDNNLQRFWLYVIAALRSRVADCGEAALALLQAPETPLTTVLTALINDLATLPQDLTLVLDDYQMIDDPAIHESCQFLLTHMPYPFHLVLAGRIDPPLSLSRLRAQGKIIEIRDQDLRFTSAETAAFLAGATGQALADEEIHILEQRTEGWVAGLQLAALAMRTRTDHTIFVQQLNGSQRLILDYMQEEILDPLPADFQRFLLRCSILQRLRADLCQAVTGEAASQQMLETLERKNLFLTALDENREWYRLHSLFREVLLARLQTSKAQEVALLHQRAARWHAAQQDISCAVGHALAAKDYELMATIMEASACRMWLNGEAPLFHNWLLQLPDVILLQHARLALTAILNFLNQTQYTSADQRAGVLARVQPTMARVERALRQPETSPLSVEDQQLLGRRLGLLRGWMAARDAHIQSNAEQLLRAGEQMQELASEDTIAWKMIPAFNLMQSSNLRGNKIALLPLLLELRQQAAIEKQCYEEIRLMGWLGNIYWDLGQLQAMQQVTVEALTRLDRQSKGRAMFGYLHLKLALFHWARDQQDEALAELHTVLDYAQTSQHIDQLIQSHCRLVPILLARGNIAEAEQQMVEAEQLARQHQWQLHCPLLAATRAHLWLAQGKLAEAVAWAELTPFDPAHLLYPRQVEYLAVARVYIAAQHPERALPFLNVLLDRAEQDQRTGDVMQILALQIVALFVSREYESARQAALRLLQLSETEGYIRLYLDAGEPMRRVLLNLREGSSGTRVSPAYLTTLLTAFNQEDSQFEVREQSALAAAPFPVEALTAREREVLSLLAQGATNQEIAGQLVVSLATAKKHVANILLKLGATNRTQAIARAREYTLL